MFKVIVLFTCFLSIGLSSDLGITKIFEPSGIISPDNYQPRAQIKNEVNGSGPYSLWVFFRINTLGGSSVYFDSASVSVTETENILFNPWTATVGVYVSRCSLYLASDTNPDNDTFSTRVKVITLMPGQWSLWDSVPAGVSGKKVKDGGGLADGSRRGEHSLYVVKGNKTNEFYQYEVILGIWQAKNPIPTAPENPGKLAKKGTCIFRSGDYVYLAKGENTLEFWGYYIPDDTWTRLHDIPAGPNGKGLKAGSSIAEGRVDNHRYLYLTKGNTREFFAYDTDLDTWFEKAPTPFLYSESKGKIKKGSCLVDDGEDIYLLRDKTNWLFFYDCDSNKWYLRESLPFYGRAFKRAKVKDGAAMVYSNGNPDIIYALKGGCNEFWAYSVSADSWTELISMPLLPSNKKVKGGGSLMPNAGGIFALKGGSTNEVWMYVPLDTLFNPFAAASDDNSNQQANITKLPLNRLPDLTSDDLMVYDVNGRIVRVVRSKAGTGQGLKSGIYFITYRNNKECNFRKVVIIR